MNLTRSADPRVSVLVLLADAGAVYGGRGAFGGEQLVKVGELTGCESTHLVEHLTRAVCNTVC